MKGICIGVKNFANFQISKLHGRLHLKRINYLKSAYNFPCEKVNFNLIHPSHITIQGF